MPEQIPASLKPLERDRHAAQSLPDQTNPHPKVPLLSSKLHHHSHRPLPVWELLGCPRMDHLAQPTCHQSPGDTGHLQGAHPRKPAQELNMISLPLLEKPCLEFNCSRAIISCLLCQGRCQGRCQSSPGLPRCCLTPPGPLPKTPKQKDHSKMPQNPTSQGDTTAYSPLPTSIQTSAEHLRTPKGHSGFSSHGQGS